MKNNIFALFAFAAVSGVCVAAGKNKLPEMSDAEFGKIEARFEERIREIRQTPNMAVPEKAVKR